jgi:hypothetical protein
MQYCLAMVGSRLIDKLEGKLSIDDYEIFETRVQREKVPRLRHLESQIVDLSTCDSQKKEG